MRFIRQTKLSEWCLHVIIHNLHRYVYGSEHIPKTHIYFLLRLYSEELYYHYKRLNRISDDSVLLFFLNHYNKVVTLPNISQGVVERLQIVGPAITSLTLHQSLASENILSSVICCVPNVKYLDLSETDCSDKTLLCIQKMCPNLVSLNLFDCVRVTEIGMGNLCGGNLAIKDLDLLYSNVNFNGLQTILKGMPTLQCLKFFNIADAILHIHKDDITVLKTIRYNLTELVYEEIDFCLDPVEVIWACSVMCPNVKKFQFKFSVPKNVIKMCNKFQNLKELEVKTSHSFFIPDVLFEILPLSNNLQKLYLNRVNLDVKILVENLKNLKTLDLRNVRFTSFDPKAINAKETKLDVLSITSNNKEFLNRALEPISLLISLSKNVTHLRLQLLKPLPLELIYTILSSMKNLVCLNVNFCNITVDQLFCFFKIPSMKRIYNDLFFDSAALDNNHPFRNIQVIQSGTSTAWRVLDNDSDYYVCESDKNAFGISYNDYEY